MNENNINQKDDSHSHEKVHSKNLDNYSGTSRKTNQKIIVNNKKVSFQVNKKQNILSNENIQSKIKKSGFNSPTQKLTSNTVNLKICKTFSKNNSNKSTKIIFPKHTKLQISLTFNGASSTQNMINKNKNKENNSNNKNKLLENNNKLSWKKITKNIKINTIVKKKNNKSKENMKKNNKEKKIENDENDIFNFTTEEYDENINDNKLNNNSRKHYSLTNPSVLPCIPFSNPFTNKNNNINITDNNEKKIKHVRSLNIDNNSDLKRKQLLMEKNYLDNLDIINVFEETEENEKEDDENVKLNISNLDIDLDQMNENIDEKNIQKNYKNSFIQFNNNLSLKLAAEKSNNTPSYMLALCPKLMLTKNKKDLIKESYAVNEPISEEIDSDSKTPKHKYSIEENYNTKYSTKEKNSDRNINKKFHEFDSEDNTFEEDYKKSTLNIDKSLEKKNNKIINMKNNKKIIKDNNIKEIKDENKNNLDKKRQKIRKKINLNEINIETQSIDNLNTINKNSKYLIIKKDNKNISPKNLSSHISNNTINHINYCETETNIINNKNIKKIRHKNNEKIENHQKAKSLLPDINLSTLYLYETIQNTSISINNSYNKKKKVFKINYKAIGYRKKILSKEKKVLDKQEHILTEIKTPKKNKSKNNKYKTNRNSQYKENENKNYYRTSYSNNNINNNQNHLKKKVHGKKSPKYNVNPFLSNFSETNDKYIYNNELNFTLNNIESKYKNYYDLFKKKNISSKLKNINNNPIFVINSNEESNKNKEKDTNIICHQKKISQQFIDEFNFKLDLKLDNNSPSNNKLNLSNKTNKKNLKRISKDYSNIITKNNNNNFKKIDEIKNEKSNNNIKKTDIIIPFHKKSKTFFISPSYAFKKDNININKTKPFYKRINKNSINNNDFNTTFEINTTKIKNINKKKIYYNTAKKGTNNKKIYNKNDVKTIKISSIKGKNKFKEIKKVIGENTISKIVHKKTNTMGNANALSFLCQNLFNYNNLIQSNNQNLFNNNISYKNYNCINKNNLHKKAASINNLINNLDNKKKIICAMQRIKFIPVSYYSKAIKEMTQINSNLLVILVYLDENQKFVFRGLYEVNKNDPQYAKIIFGPGCELNILNVNNINNFFNYSLSRGDFFRYKLIDEKNKKFNEDIIIVF